MVIEVGVLVMLVIDLLFDDFGEIKKFVLEIGYLVMLKVFWGGGGCGMCVILDEEMFEKKVLVVKCEVKVVFGKDEIYLEKLV